MNVQQLNSLRAMTLIFGGMTGGIFGLDGLQGIIFYFGLILFVSLVIAVRLGFKGQPYFTTL